MEAIIREDFNEKVVEEAKKLYNIKPDTLKSLGGFENFVYEYEYEKEFYILRFVHSSHRDEKQVLAEIEFIDYLSKNGARVSNIAHSKNDKITERIEAEKGYFIVSSFTKAPGTFVKKSDLTPEFWIKFGQEVGRLHRLSKTYKPVHKRQSWDEDNFFRLAKDYLNEEEYFIADRLNNIKETVQNLEQNIDNYGLIHTDLHFGNMFYNNGDFTFFDFDDLAYKHYISDIAIIIYYLFFHSDNPLEERSKEVNKFIKDFMKGYEKENHLEKEWFDNINIFLQMRDTIMYVVLKAGFDDLDNHEHYSKVANNIKKRCINNEDYIDVNIAFDGLWNS